MAKGRYCVRHGKLIAPTELEKMANKDGWTSQAHSVFKLPMSHLVITPKFRAKVFTSYIACELDHCHILLAGQTPQTCWSDWICKFKARSSRQLKMLPGLETFRWAVGYSLNSVGIGGRQGAEEAIRAVEEYIKRQGDQDDGADEGEGS